MPEGLNYYDVLQVSPHATPDVIKAAHRALSKTMHPDAGGSNELAVAINEALDVLSNPTQRTRYDLELRIGKAKTFAAGSTAPKERVVEVLIVVCLGCGFKNRVQELAFIARAKCGSCGARFSVEASPTGQDPPRSGPSSDPESGVSGTKHANEPGGAAASIISGVAPALGLSFTVVMVISFISYITK